MRSFELNKIVRPGIYKNMLEIGQKVTPRVVEGLEKRMALKAKAAEECAEIDPTDDDPTEVLDLLEAAEALGKDMGYTYEQLREAQLKRRDEVGGFDDGIYIDRLDLPDGDKWIDYYASQPDRFREIRPPEAPQTP